MATLGSVFHDFPRLAKQSGFYFQLHSGRVNWSEIESVNLDEIIEKRNFQLLEDNLINVINCNLEREYDLKILDPNFVKLFKLAQLGVDYLSYCQMYLDKCVILLQEQLTAFQEDYEALKHENQRWKEELNKNKRRNRLQNYQCEKCEKVFISDVYLKYHDKRRHSTPNTPDSLDKSQKRCIDNWQQTDDESKLSTSTQTLYFEEPSTVTQEKEDRDNIKIEYTFKIEKLEQELKDLKERLKKAETSLTERIEPPQSNIFQSPYPPGSLYYNPMVMLLPSYVKQSNNGPFEVNPGCQMPVPVPEIPKPNSTPYRDKSAEVENIPQSQISPQSIPELEKIEKSSVTTENIESIQEYQTGRNDNLECDKENLDPDVQKNISINLGKPLPPPRKSKIKPRVQLPVSKMPVEEIVVVKDLHEEEPEIFESQSIIHSSTPIKSPTEEDSEIHNEEIKKQETNPTESLFSRNTTESKSLIKKIVGNKSPKLGKFRKSLKRSLTNLYDSVSSNEKDSKKREPNEQNSREAIINGMENRLRELGVNPEWQGIPKKTMKQKLNMLKFKQKLLSKENPMYPIIRQNIEEKIVQKLKNNFGKSTIIKKLNKQQSTNVEDTTIESLQCSESKPEFVKLKNCGMYDIESDSESQSSDSERNFDQTPLQTTSEKSVVLTSFCENEDTERVKEFDFSVFQVGSGSVNSLTEEDTRLKEVSVLKGLNSDSDSDDNFLEQLDEKLFKTSTAYLTEKKKTETPIIAANDQHEPSFSRKSKEDTHNSILKDSEGFQSRLSSGGKKKVFFANYSDIEEELSDSPLEDDLWPFKSDSEKDVG